MGAPLADWTPTVQDVANIVPHRTGDLDGEAQGTFTADTVPTATQVQGLVRQVQSEVVAAIGEMPDELADIPAGGTIGESPAGHVVALGAAAMVEDSFYPDLQLGGQSTAQRLWERYQAALRALVAAAAALEGGGDPGDSLLPTATFPVASPIQWAEL